MRPPQAAPPQLPSAERLQSTPLPGKFKAQEEKAGKEHFYTGADSVVPWHRASSGWAANVFPEPVSTAIFEQMPSEQKLNDNGLCTIFSLTGLPVNMYLQKRVHQTPRDIKQKRKRQGILCRLKI